MTVKEARELFPILDTKVYGKPIVYLDNAATSQRPRQVIDRLTRLALQDNANIHRAVHSLAAAATDEYESARECVRDFLNAESTREIIFTSGTTASINLVAYSFGEAFIREGDEVIVSEAEHHSDIVPWQIVCGRKGAVLKVLKVDDDGVLDVDGLESLISPRTRIVAVTQISNVLGLVNPVKEIVRIAHSHGVPVLVDGAQGVVHCGMDVRDTDVDFYAFSGHKMYAPTGTGVLYGKEKYLEQMPPFIGGGEMIETVRFSGTSYAALPEKFEAGTQNFNATPCFKDAIEIWKLLNDNELIQNSENIRDYLMDKFSSDSRFRLFGVPRRTSDKIPLFSFCVEGVHHEDLALILDKMGIAARSGQMCAEPLMDRMGVTGMLRVSFAPYNTMEEAEYLVKSLDKAISMLV